LTRLVPTSALTAAPSEPCDASGRASAPQQQLENRARISAAATAALAAGIKGGGAVVFHTFLLHVTTQPKKLFQHTKSEKKAKNNLFFFLSLHIR
jgi:hypothetical protein